MMEEFILTCEQIISEVILDSIDNDWNEDFITRSLLLRFRNRLLNQEIRYPDFTKKVYWKSYKNTGKIEQNFGDIALIINIQFSSGETLKGVVFLEAKKEYDSNKFEAVDYGQLRTIKQHAHYSHILFYSKNPHGYTSKLVCCEYDSYVRAAPINTSLQLFPLIHKVYL